MTAQQVLKAFMESLANHGYSQSTATGTGMLDAAIRASSRYSTAQEAIDAMKADQIAAEKEAVAEIFGEEKLLSELTDTQRNDSAESYAATQSSNAYISDYTDKRSTVENYIKERKAYIFLEKYCGIILPKKHWFNEKGIVTYWDSESSGNNDTGAITGLDAGGSATEKTDRSIVPETYINTYRAASGAEAQTIVTNKRDWIIQATDNTDIITSNGADSINAGAGDDEITANGDGATITSGAGSDFITVTESVTDITLSDLNADDTLTISGTFEAGSAQIEDMLLVITDKTGKRKIRLGNLESAGNANVNVGSVSTKIAEWLLDAGIDLDLAKTKTTNYSDGKVISSSSGDTSAEVLGESSGEGDGRTVIDPDYTPTDPPVDKTKDPVISKRGIKSTKGTLNSGAVPENLTVNGVAVTKTGKDDTDRNVSDGSNVIGTLSSEFPDATTFTRNGLTIHLLGESSSTGSPTDNGTSLITPKTYSELTTDQKTILAGLFKWWGNECLKLNEESYDISFNSPTTMVKDIGLYFFDGTNSNTLATVWNWQRSGYDGYATQLMLNVNMKYYKDLNANDVDGESNVSGAGFLDRTLAHEFTHAVMAANVNYFNSLPKFIKEGIAELTHGIDDERGKVIFEIASDATELNGSLQLSNTGTGSQAVGDGYAGGFMFLRYLAKTAAAQTASAPAYGDITATVNLSGDGFYYIVPSTATPPVSTVSTEADIPSDAIKLGELSGGVYTVNPNTGVHQIISGAAQVSGLTYNDTYNGTSGADTIITAEGTNVIAGGGNDSVEVYGQYSTINTGAGDDTITIVDGGHHSIDTGDGANLVTFQPSWNCGNSVIGGAGSDTVDETGNGGGEKNYFNLGAGDDSVNFGDDDSTIQMGDGNDTVSFKFADQANNFVDLGAGNDSVIIGGSDHTIIGGAGDDTINQYSDSAGGNIFLYTEEDFGDDTIKNFKANDKILIIAESTAQTAYSDNTLTVTDGDKTVGTIKISGTFDTATNLVFRQKAPVTVITENGTVTLTDGDDTIKIRADAVTQITFTGTFSGGDVIQFVDASGNPVAVTELTTDESGNVIATVGGNSVTLSGLTLSTNGKIWTLDENNHAKYGDGTTAGAYISGGKISYREAEVTTAELELDGIANLDGLSVETFDNTFVNIKASAVGDNGASIVSHAGGYTFELYNDWQGKTFTGTDNADDITADGNATNVSVNAGAGDDTITNRGDSNNSIDGGAGNDQIINHGSNNSITGGAGNDQITIYSSNNSINGGADDDTIFLGDSSGNTINTADGNDTIQIYTRNEVNDFTVENFGAGDVIQFISYEYNPEWNPGMPEDQRQFKVVVAIDSLTEVDGKLVATAGGKTVTIGGISPYTDVDTWNGFTFTNTKTAGATIDNGNIIYDATASTTTFFTLTGIANTTDIVVDKTAKTVTLKSTNLNKTEVTITGDYTLAIEGATEGKLILTPETSANLGAADAEDIRTYTAATTTAESYDVAQDGKSIAYTAATGGEEIKIKGLSETATAADITFDKANNKVTISSTALDNKSVSLETTGYTLELSGVTAPEEIAAGLTKSGDNFIYNNACVKTAGYRADGTYVPATTERSFTLSGLSDAAVLGENVIVTDGDTTNFKFKAAALSKENVTITGGTFSVALDDDVDQTAETIAESKTLTNGTLNYQASGTGEYYATSESGVTYTAQVGGEQFTLTGITNADGVTVSDKTVTVAAEALDMTATTAYTVTLTGEDFTLNFTANTSSAENSATLNDGVYTSAYTPAYFTGSDKSYTFAPATTPKTFTITGLSDAAVLGENVFVTDGDTTNFKLKAAALNKETVTITGGTFSVALDDDVDQTAETISESKTLTDGTLNYQAVGTGEFYAATSTGVTYTAQVGGETFTLTGITDADGVTVSNKTVTVAESALNMEATEAYTVTLTGDDFTLNFTANTSNAETSATLEGGVYTSAYTPAYFTGSDKTYTFSPATTPKTFTITGLSANAALGTNVTVTDGETTVFKFKAAALNKENVTIMGGNFSVELDSDVDTEAETIAESKNLDGTTLNYQAVGTGEFYAVTSTGVTYTAQVGGETFTLTGITNENGVTVNGKEVTVSADALDMTATAAYTVTLNGDDFTLNFTANTSNAENSATLNDGVYTSAYIPAYFTGSDKSYTFAPATTPKTFTITGLSDAAVLGENVTVANGKVIISNGALDAEHKDISLENATGYEIELGGDVDKFATINFSAQESGTYSVTLAGNTQGYKLEDGVYKWQGATGGEQLTITGLKSGLTLTADNFARDATGKVTFKLEDSMLDDTSTVSITGDCTLDSSALPTSEAVEAHWDGVNYIDSKSKSEVTVNIDKSITYTRSTGGETLFTLTGIVDTEGIDVDKENKTVTLKATNLNEANVTISNGDYTLKLDATDSAIPTDKSEVAEKWTESGGNYIYRDKSNAAYYEETADGIHYEPAHGGEELFSISGLGTLTIDADGATTQITVSGSTVTINDTAVFDTTSKAAVSLSTNDYSLALGVTATEATDGTLARTISEGWSGTTYTAAGNTAGYALEGGQIIYKNQAGGEQFSVSGTSDTSGISVSGKTVTINETSLGQGTVTLTNIDNADYTFEVATGIKISAETTARSLVNGTYTTPKISAYYKQETSANSTTFTYQAETGGDTITITGLKDGAALDTDVLIDDEAKTITLKATALNQQAVSVTGDYTLKLDDSDSNIPTDSTAKDAGWNGLTYTAAGTPAYYSQTDDKNISFTAKSGMETFTISGVKSTEGVTVSGKTITISSMALDAQNISITTADGYTLKLDADDTDIPTDSTQTAESWTANGTAYTYKDKTNVAYYEATDDTTITYTPEHGGEELFTVKGLKSLTISGGKTTQITVGELSGGKRTLTINDTSILPTTNANVTITPKTGSYDFAFAANVTDTGKLLATEITSGWSGTTYTAEGTSKGYTVENGNIVYKIQIGGEQFTVTGTSDVSDIDVNGKIVTVGEKSLSTEKVTLKNLNKADFSFYLDRDVLTYESYEDPTLEETSSGKYTYTTEKTLPYYTESSTSSSTSFTYHKAKGGEEIKLTGLASGLTLDREISFDEDAKTITLTNDALAEKSASTNNYKFVFDSDVPTIETISQGWDGLTYTAAGKTAGYKISNGKQISYSKQTGGEQFTISGIADTSGVKVSNKAVTINQSALNESDIELDSEDNFYLVLDSKVDKPKTIRGGWSGKNGTFTHTEEGTSAGYTKDSSTYISYYKQVGGEQFTISGIKSTSGVDIRRKVVTVNKSALDGKDIELSTDYGYTLAVAKDVPAVTETAAGWSGFTYTSAGNSEGYTLSGNKITYTAAVESSQFTISGVKDTSDVKIDGTTVTVNKSALDGAEVSITGDGYKLIINDDLPSEPSEPLTGDDGGDDEPKPSTGGDDEPKPSTGGDDEPKPSTGGDDEPKPSTGGDDEPKPSTGGDDEPKPSTGGDDEPKPSTGGDDEPKPSTGGDSTSKSPMSSYLSNLLAKLTGKSSSMTTPSTSGGDTQPSTTGGDSQPSTPSTSGGSSTPKSSMSSYLSNLLAKLTGKTSSTTTTPTSGDTQPSTSSGDSQPSTPSTSGGSLTPKSSMSSYLSNLLAKLKGISSSTSRSLAVSYDSLWGSHDTSSVLYETEDDAKYTTDNDISQITDVFASDNSNYDVNSQFNSVSFNDFSATNFVSGKGNLNSFTKK